MDGDALGLPGTEDSLTGKEHTPSAMCDAPTPLPESPEDEQTRFRVELEFVQCLANPLYLHCLSPSTTYTHTPFSCSHSDVCCCSRSPAVLARSGYFDDAAFVRYLEYLLYWKEPRYAQYIVYPHALFFLDKLQEPAFRRSLLNEETAVFMHRQQNLHWQFAVQNRAQAALALKQQQQQQQQEQESASTSGTK